MGEGHLQITFNISTGGARTMAKARSLTVYLIKKNEPNPRLLIKDSNLRPEEIILPSGTIWSLFVQKALLKPPRWADFFVPHVDPNRFGRVGSASAVLLIPGDGLWWALTFGQGRHLIHEGLCSEGFGLRVALNTLGDENLRSIDKDTFDMVAGHARQQAMREVGTAEFGLDIERDLLWAVTGTPADKTLGQQMTGRDALVISTHIDLEGLEAFLPRLYPAYIDTRYKKNFAWIDNVCEADEDERQLLDLELIDRLVESNFEQTWLAPPEILEWSNVRYFSYSEAYRSAERFDVHWTTFFDEKVNNPATLSVEFLKSRHIFCVGDDGITLKKWPVYRCIYAEIDYPDASYFLTGGHWYRITRSFVDQINEAVGGIPVLERYLPDYKDNTEDDYNVRVGSSGSGFHLMHRVLVPYGGGKSSLEFCDLLGPAGDIIHVKRYSGSRDLSHLFEQALNSGQLFQLDEGFRRAVDPHLPEGLRGRFIATRPAARELRVVLAIVSKSLKPLNLPFFAKLSLRHAAQRLEIFGFRVALAKIGTEQLHAKLQHYEKREKRKTRERV
jgi:uncharacterized protein (TIGR04141 family)